MVEETEIDIGEIVQAVLSVIIPLLGAIGILIAIFFALRAVSSHVQAGRQAYGVGQLESRRSMQKDLIWAVMALVGGLLFLGLYALLPEASQASPEPVATPQTTPESIETVLSPAGETAVPATPSSHTPAPFPESQVTVLPTNPPPPTQTTVPTATPSPEPQTAVVASGVGVYLREQPSVTAPDLEWLLEGTSLLVLSGEADADGYRWVLVRTPEGNEGWVATDFIEITP